MAPFIPNGVYVIRNVGSGDVVCLQYGIPGEGPITGCKDGPGYPCERGNLWRITNIGGGGNQVIIESVCDPGRFANAHESQDSPLFGSLERTVWTIVKVDRGYYLQSPDADFVWKFDGEGKPIVLIHHTAEDDTRWVFIKV